LPEAAAACAGLACCDGGGLAANRPLQEREQEQEQEEEEKDRKGAEEGHGFTDSGI
jgi:hypothetical protein